MEETEETVEEMRPGENELEEEREEENTIEKREEIDVEINDNRIVSSLSERLVAF